jgi:predicted acyltransferase
VTAAASPPVPPPPAGLPSRWLGLDALRGLSIAAMILVNNPGRWGETYQYDPLRHATWHGCTFTDLVFPTFLFCAGVAIVPALGKKVDAGAACGPLVYGIGKRVLSLVLLGLLLSAFPLVTFAPGKDLFAPLFATRFPGVLQRIGVCYGVAALLFLFTTATTQRLVLLGCLFGYWALITLVPVPGVGMPNLDDPVATLQGWVDRAVFGSHIWVKGQYDPEGVLSTIPAVATALFGVEAGRVLRGAGDAAAKSATLLRLGALWALGGAIWSWFLPLNKPLWTSSYALWTAGVATLGLGLGVWAFEQRGWTQWAHPLRVYGQNALLVFVGSGLVGRIVGSLVTIPIDGKPVAIKEAFFANWLLAPIGDARLASLAFGLVWVLGWYVVLAWLFRRGVVWRV